MSEKKQVEKPPSGEDPNELKMGAAVAIGLALGVSLGVAMDNIAIGIAIGLSIGIAIGASQGEDGKTDESPQSDSNSSL